MVFINPGLRPGLMNYALSELILAILIIYCFGQQDLPGLKLFFIPYSPTENFKLKTCPPDYGLRTPDYFFIDKGIQMYILRL